MYLSKSYLNELVQKKSLDAKIRLADSLIKKQYDIFLSYSLHDLSFAKKIFNLLIKKGFSVYADFIDPSFSRQNVNKKTAKKLSKMISKCKSLIYIHSKSAAVSKWCPWEIGLASGLKNFRCAIMPLVEELDSEFERQEYLLLYPIIDYNKDHNGIYMFWSNDNNKYNTLSDWIITGKNPKTI